MLASGFVIEQVLMLKSKNQALLQFADLASAISFMQYYSTSAQASIRHVYCDFHACIFTNLVYFIIMLLFIRQFSSFLLFLLLHQNLHIFHLCPPLQQFPIPFPLLLFNSTLKRPKCLPPILKPPRIILQFWFDSRPR